MTHKGAIIGAFFLGALIAGFTANFYYARQTKTELLVSGYYYENLIRRQIIYDSIKTLKNLRSSDYSNALVQCEHRIDVAVKGLAWLARDSQTNRLVPEKERSYCFTNFLGGVYDAKKHREINPYQSGNRDNDNEVSNAFSLLNTRTNH